MTVLQVPTLDFLNEKLGQYMSMYNDTVRGAHLDLVFFKDAMTHLVKVNTVLLLLFSRQGRFDNSSSLSKYKKRPYLKS